ncbi:right-handed parallel beta-helix repeat-containing protein [bacterium]|nr:right-handed parallel beta-helix repeat-containing protein [bacterium]
MKKLAVFCSALMILFFVHVSIAVQVDGYCYLEGETDHSGTKVLFLAASPSAVTDSVYTGISGDYQLDVVGGLYDVYFTHDGFHSDDITGQNCFDPITLPDVTLLSTVGEISGAISGILAAGEYLVVGDLSIVDGETLTIEPGSVFLFDGIYAFTIGSNTTLICQGTETDSIKFTPNYDGGITWWVGIHFLNSNSDDIIEYCLITGCAGTGILCDHSDPTISHSSFIGNYGSDSTAGIYCDHANPVISHCIFSENYCDSGTAGISCSYSSPIIVDCLIIDNDDWGISIWHSSNPTITNCTIEGNSNGAIGCGSSSPTFINCTINGNSAGFSSSVIRCTSSANPTFINCTINGNNSGNSGVVMNLNDSSNPTISNCAVTNNTGVAISTDNDSEPEISYSDFYNNSDGDFSGDGINPNLGVIVTTNANGDPCDAWFNIFEDPLYVDPNNGDLHLQETSPCVDAGDPTSPLDPDDTVADIGAFYFDQSNPDPVEVTLTPTSSTDIPAAGGTISYDANVVSNVPGTYPNVVFWTKVKLPDGSFFPTIQFQTSFTLTPYMNVSGSLTQDVPAFAPDGNYELWGYVGFNPNGDLRYGNFFPFTKSSTAVYTDPADSWASMGDAVPTVYEMQTAYPNPFNAATTLTVNLPESAELHVTVYNVQGRQVAELANGSYTAGTHRFTFEASGLASGLYFVRAMVPGQFEQTQKLVLMR